MHHIYDNETFFEAYARMARSRQGLAGAGEWHQMNAMFPDLTGKRVLDLGCGYGWHCKYAAGQGAASVLGLDLSEKMIRTARAKNAGDNITYQVCDLRTYSYPAEHFDFVLSNLALHYIADLDRIYASVYRTLTPDGIFLFNIEHPVFTGSVGQDWIYDETGAPLYWPVDKYYMPGSRITHFLGQTVEKQHHTLTQILNGLLSCGFLLEDIQEAVPDPSMLHLPGMQEEMRRPMMLLVKARKPGRA